MNSSRIESDGLSRSQIIWGPTLTFHDPNPPITLEDAPSTATLLWGAVFPDGGMPKLFAVATGLVPGRQKA